nr:GAF domain-containing SpoIIE family protein phosphatase [Actinopolyspora halophila]
MTAENVTHVTRTRSGRAGNSAEAGRLAAVEHYSILDTPPEGAFDRLAALAARWLETPFATVSFVDADRVWFKAVHGLEGTTQVSHDHGLAASAIRDDEPCAIRDVLSDPRTGNTPSVPDECGLRSYAAAPIITPEGHRLGTVDVFDTRPREFHGSELSTLAELAAVAMDALELRLSTLTTLRHERQLRKQLESFASTLQRTLLPPSLPAVPGLQLSCHYHTADPGEVTGDFYDVFALADGRWAFFLGDVSGHGSSAATVASLTRYTLRTAAMHSADPTAVLEELNTVLLHDPNVSHSATVLFGVLAPDSEGGFDIVLAGGGHPPALWLRPEVDGGSGVEEVWPEGGMLVGALPDASFATRRLRLRPGQTLLLYTDGLTEARPGGELYGEERLAEFLTRHVDVGATALVGELDGLLAEFGSAVTDDVALLAMSVPRD